MMLEVIVFKELDKRNSYKVNKVLLNQVIGILETNNRNYKELYESVKDDYIVRAQSVSYILDSKPQAISDVAELNKIADLLCIDEINIFNSSGTIYSGTVKKYYGLNFDSGEQMSYFKPMLKDKKLSMCQDVTPNTSEGKSMMYAITWNENGTRMIQIGIEPARLLEVMERNELTTVLNNLPNYNGNQIFVANIKSRSLIAGNFFYTPGTTLSQIGFNTYFPETNEIKNKTLRINGKKNFCTFETNGEFLLCVCSSAYSNQTTFIVTTLLFTIYLVIAGLFISNAVISKFDVEEEKQTQGKEILNLEKKSTTDELTNLLNRRAYQEYLPVLDVSSNFVYLSFDLNGLKNANDTIGHDAGDELIIAASDFMVDCFSPFGNIYRTGGDEFVAILTKNTDEVPGKLEEFKKRVANWTGKLCQSMSISYGYVESKERNWNSVQEIIKESDIRMYIAKENYYRKSGVDRRAFQRTYTALGALYTKILKVNLSEDTYKIVKVNKEEQTEDKGYKNSISEWLLDFAATGQVFSEDVNNYVKKTDISYLRRYFKNGNKVLSILYRRKIGDRFKQCLMEIIPSDDYSDFDQNCFLYVKDISGDND